MDINKLLSKLENIPRRNRILVFLIIILVFVGSYWYFIFSPNYNKITLLKKEISRLDQEIRRNRFKIAKFGKYKKELQEKKKIFYFAKKLLPDTNIEVENLLANIETLGNDVGVEFILFQPGKEVKTDFYARRQVTLKLSGPFPNLMKFLSHISNLNRLVTLDSVKFRPNRNFIITADCYISIYRSLTPKELEARKNKRNKR